MQRVTALILIPLTFWFVYHCIFISYLNFNEIIVFFKSKFNSFLFLILMISMLLHAKLGCETIAEDYLTTKKLKIITKFSISITVYFFMILAILSIFKIVFI